MSSAGDICVNTLKKDWQASYGIAHILVTVKCLLIYPNPESALDEEAGKLLLEDYNSYCSRAKLMTSVHARARPAAFDTPAASTSSTSQPLQRLLPLLRPIRRAPRRRALHRLARRRRRCRAPVHILVRRAQG